VKRPTSKTKTKSTVKKKTTTARFEEELRKLSQRLDEFEKDLKALKDMVHPREKVEEEKQTAA
jgi:glutaredoxin 2